MAECRELSRGNHLFEPAGLPWLPLPAWLTPLNPLALLVSAIKQSQRKLMEKMSLRVLPLPTLAVRKLVSFSVKAIDFLPPSGQPCIMLLPGSESCAFHQYVSFRSFIYGIKEELSWVACYLGSPDLKCTWKMQAALQITNLTSSLSISWHAPYLERQNKQTNKRQRR